MKKKMKETKILYELLYDEHFDVLSLRVTYIGGYISKAKIKKKKLIVEQ